MPDGSEFQTVGAAILKPRETKVVRTRGTDNRLVFEEHRKNAWEYHPSMVIQKGVWR